MISLKKRTSEEKHVKSIYIYIYVNWKMDDTDLKAYKRQVTYIEKIYEMNIPEIDYQNTINELRKLVKVYEGVFDL